MYHYGRLLYKLLQWSVYCKCHVLAFRRMDFFSDHSPSVTAVCVNARWQGVLNAHIHSCKCRYGHTYTQSHGYTHVLLTNSCTRGRRWTNRHTNKRKYMIYKRNVSFDRLISKLLCWNRCCVCFRVYIHAVQMCQKTYVCVCVCVYRYLKSTYVHYSVYSL